MNDMFCQSMKGAIAPKVAGKPNIALFWRLVFIHFVALVLMTGSASLSAQDAEPVKILAVGDSLCEGDDGEVTWRYYLGRHLTGANVTFVGRDDRPRYNFELGYEGYYGGGVWNKNHECIWGNTAQGEFDNSDGVWLGERLLHHKPDYLLLMIGTNDLTLIGTDRSQTNARNPDIDLSEQAFQITRNLVNSALAIDRSVKIILAGIPPNAWFGFLSEGAELYANYNQKLASFAESTARLTYADTLWNPYLLATDTNGDGTHPSPTGYDKIAEQFAAALAENGVGASTYDNRLSPTQAHFPRPRAPRNLEAKPIWLGAELSWDAVAGAVDYHIYQSENGGPFKLVRYSIPTTHTTVTGLNPSFIYRYQVMAVVSGDITARSNIASVRADSKPKPTLGAVTGLKVQPGVNSAHLTWDAIPGVSDYRVYLSDNDINYTIVNYNNTKPEALLGLLESGKTYYFQVDAVVGMELTQRSNAVSTTILDTPSRPILWSGSGTNSAQLFWYEVPHALGYEVQRREGQSNWSSVYIGNSLTHAQFPLENNVQYQYRVRASLPFWSYTPWSATETVLLTSAVPNPPTTELDVSIVENPLLCNGALRTVAVVSGFYDNESVVVNVNGTDYPARSASGGRRTISWSCENGGASLRFIARGLSSGLRASFSVQTQGAADPICVPAVKREYPGGEIVDHLIVTQHAVSVSAPLEPFEEGCRGTQRNSFDAGERVQTRGFAGGYLQLVDRSWIRASAVGPVQPMPEPPPGLADTMSRSAQMLLSVIESEIDRTRIHEEVDGEYLVQCFKLIRERDISTSELDLSSGVACIQTASISIYRSSRNTKWFDDIIEALVNELLPALGQGIDDFIQHPIVEVLGISDIMRCAEGQEGRYCIYAAAGVIPIPAGKLPKVLSFLRSSRASNRLSAAATRFSDDAAIFARYCRVSGANSFHKDTLVSVDAGFLPISQIEIGDLVWAYNEKSAEQSLQPVENLISGEGKKVLVEIILDRGETITATGGHPFYLPRSKTWANAEDLKNGQQLLGRDGSLIEIVQTVKRTEETKVYNLTVANDHTYYAGAAAVLNHNASGCKFPKWTTTSTNHLRGEFSATTGRFVGYHSRYLGKDRAGVRIFERSAANNKGVYTARVEALKDSDDWVRKTARSTFFPDSWALDRIQREVKNAYATARLNGQTGTILTEKSSTGFDILIQVDASDNIIRAHPLL